MPTRPISKRIRALREKRGLTRSQLAREVGVTFAGVFNWEKEGRTPRMDTLTRLAEVLGVTTHYLMTGSEEGGHEEPAKRRKNTVESVLEQAQQDFAAVMGLAPERVRVTVEIIRGPAGGEVISRKSSR
jgi:transcriptional regulator with XRE-family HTH domain